jgi:excisionase family DNA binding protein
MSDDSERLTLTVKEARLLLGVSRGLMYEAIRRGEIPSIRVGRRILIPYAAFMKFLEAANQKGAA